MFLDRNNYPDKSSDIPYGSIGLFELVNPVYASSAVIVNNALLTETVDFIMTENDENLAME